MILMITDEQLQADGISKFEIMLLRELSEHRDMITKGFESNANEHKEIQSSLEKVKIDEMELRLKSSLWGSVSAALVTLISVLFRK